MDHGDPVGDLARARHVMGDGERGGPQRAHAVHNQVIDHIGHNGVEPGGRLIKEDDIGVGRDRAGETDALLHPT